MARKSTHSSPVSRVPVFLDSGKVKISNILDKIERTFLPVGAQIGKYSIIKEIDRGGMAVVYRATQLDLDRTVALKVLPANITINRGFVERFLSEAHAVAKLNHPNIVSIHEVSMENNIYFLAMDYVPGTNLFYFMNQKKPKLVEVLEIFIQLADALAYAHEQRIVHRDLKLNNVIMRDNRMPVLIDFGLAKVIEDEEDGLTKTGEIMGSPAYMAPERILGSGADSRSDICSLGIMLYELLTLKNPYLDPRSIHQTTLNVIEADPVAPRKLVPWLPAEIEAITLKAMCREPDARYQTMKEFRDDLLRYQRGEQVLANPPSLWSKVRYRARKNWPALAIVSTVLIFCAVLASVLYFQSRKEQWNWRLISEEQFVAQPRGEAWYIYDGLAETPTAEWVVKDGALRVKGTGYSFLRFERLFTRDLRFEFDIYALSKTLHDVGFFVGGNDPVSGYRFHIHRDPEARCGITYPRNDFLFAEYDPLTFPARSAYHVVVEKTDNAITFTVDGYLVAHIRDYFPPLNREQQKVGFFVNGGECAIDNVSVYRLAMPELASPTIIADRFWAHGDFYAALEEYKELLLDASQEDIVHTVKLRMSDCFIRTGDFEQAEALLTEEQIVSSKNDSRLAKVLYLRGILAERQGERHRAEKVFSELARRFPSDPHNESVCEMMLLEAVESLDMDTVGLAENRVESLVQRYPRYSGMCGQAHLMVLNYFTSRGIVDRARTIGNQILALYEKTPDVAARARTLLALMYLGKRKKQNALEMLNRAVTTHEPSGGTWQAWLTLADIYENDHNYGDALTIYRKVYEECPRTSSICWDARIKMGEIARTAAFEEQPHRIFTDVATANHPFALPRLIAEFYTDKISDKEFADTWYQLTRAVPRHLYHKARKELMAGNTTRAVQYLEEYLLCLSSDSWEYVKAYTLKTYCEK